MNPTNNLPPFERVFAPAPRQMLGFDHINPFWHYVRKIRNKHDNEEMLQIITEGRGFGDATLYHGNWPDVPMLKLDDAFAIADENALEFVDAVWEPVEWDDE
jgi:hypothetical protein